MQKNTIIGLAAVVLLMLGIIVFAALRPVPAIAPADGALPLPAGTYTEHTQYYDIAANYATSTSLRGAANTAAIALMQDFIRDTIAQFKTDGNFANLTAKDIEMMGFSEERKEKLQIVYLIASSPRTVSYIFTIYADTLGAHGNTYFQTFTFDTSSGKLLTLADIFVTDSYLSTLSSLSRAKLPAILRDSSEQRFINSGTGPDSQNFATFFFDNQDFVILFAPYAVAPYAAGPQTLRIPLTELSSILKPEYR